MSRPLTKRQLALLHVAKAKLGMDDAEYRQTLLHFCDVESAKDLDRDGFDTVMGYMEWRGFAPLTPPPLKRTPGARPGFATPAQLDFIRDMWRRYSGDWDEGLTAWLENSFGVSDLRFLDRATTDKAITALKTMSLRPRKEAP